MKAILITSIFVMTYGSAAFADPNGACDTSKMKMSFFKNCTYVGGSKAMSRASKADSDKVESICRCIATQFGVEKVKTTEKCAFNMNEVRVLIKNDKAVLACGSF